MSPLNQYARHEDRLGQLLQFVGVAHQVLLDGERGQGSSVQPAQPGPRVLKVPAPLLDFPSLIPFVPKPRLLGPCPAAAKGERPFCSAQLSHTQVCSPQAPQSLS